MFERVLCILLDGKLPTLAAETELDEVVQEGAQARRYIWRPAMQQETSLQVIGSNHDNIDNPWKFHNSSDVFVGISAASSLVTCYYALILQG